MVRFFKNIYISLIIYFVNKGVFLKMARKRKIKREEIAITVAALAVIMMIASGGITITGAATIEKDFQMPDQQCNKFVSTRDNLVQNHADSECTLYAFERENPCTGTEMDGTKFCDENGLRRRIVFDNGDIKGLAHYKTYPLSYVLCADGRAKADVVKMPYVVGGIAYGLWYYNPNVNYWNQYTIEKCNTI
jgi:hypothetical protein